MLKEIYDYREMIFSLVRRDLIGKYKKSVLGFFWTMLEPLLQLLVYTLVFTYIMPMGVEKFYMHLFVALIPWGYFSGCLSGGSAVILNQQDMIKKIYFPREILPIVYATSQFVSMALSFVVVIIMVLVSGIGINPAALVCLPVVMIIEYLLCLGVVLLVSSVTVYLRDMQMILNVLGMALIYASPVIYPVSMIPQQILPWYMLNPITALICAYRDILFYRKVPDFRYLMFSLLAAAILFAVGEIVFCTLKKRFVEEF